MNAVVRVCPEFHLILDSSIGALSTCLRSVRTKQYLTFTPWTTVSITLEDRVKKSSKRPTDVVAAQRTLRRLGEPAVAPHRQIDPC